MKFEEKVRKCFQLIVIVLCITQIIAEKSRCNSSLCNCSRFGHKKVFSCPRNNPIVTFQITNSYVGRIGHPLIEAIISCYTNDQLVYDVISQTNVEYFDRVYYAACPLPLNSSLGRGMPILDSITFDTDGSTTFNHWKSIHFSGLTNLKELELNFGSVESYGSLDQLPSDTFAASPQLKRVNLEMKHPNLYLFPSAEIYKIGGVDGDSFNADALQRNSVLKSVELFSSKFNHLTRSALEGFKNLEKLTLFDNEITVIDRDCLNSFVNLREITIYLNKIKDFPSDIFNENKQLRKVVIRNEKIKTLPNKVFSDLPELKSVSISYSDLEDIPSDIFENSVNIEYVEFLSLQIATLPQGLFDNLPRLKEIRIMQNNKLDSFAPGLFDQLSSLQVLNLAANQFETISAANIKVGSKALFIDLRMNEIEDVTVNDLELFVKNTTVDLGFNKISRFSGIVQLRQHLDRYNSTVYLRGNPFNCSTCDVFHIVQERRREPDDPDDFVTKPFSFNITDFKCSEPLAFRSTSVRRLNLANYDCKLSADKTN